MRKQVFQARRCLLRLKEKKRSGCYCFNIINDLEEVQRYETVQGNNGRPV